MGHASVADRVNTVSVGRAGAERQVVNVKAGTQGTDAVNFDQLKGVSSSVATALGGGASVKTDGTVDPGFTVNGTKYGNVADAIQAASSSTSGDSLNWNATLGAYDASHGSGKPQKVTNVAAGKLSADSTEAVNGAQLNQTNQDISNLTGATTNIFNNGTKYFHANSTGADSSATGQDAVAVGMGASASATNSMAFGPGSLATGVNSMAYGSKASATGGGSVAIGAGASSAAANSLALGSQSNASFINSVAIGANTRTSRSNSVSFGGRVLTDVNAGVQDTDAVNFAQLKNMMGSSVTETVSSLLKSQSFMAAPEQVAAAATPEASGKSLLMGGSVLQAEAEAEVTSIPFFRTSSNPEYGDAHAGGLDSIAIGMEATTTGSNDIAIGTGSYTGRPPSGAGADGLGSIAIGADAMALTGSTAIGNQAKTLKEDQVAIGHGATVSDTGGAGTAIGARAMVTGNSGVAIGNTTTASGSQSLALGTLASATGDRSQALGYAANANKVNSTAIGAYSVTRFGAQTGYTAAVLTAPQNSIGEVAVGTATGQRTISGVAAGKDDYDAVNVKQLLAVSAGSTSDAVKYDSSAHDKVTLGGADGTTITNVAAGELSADSTDAVNGSQLFDTNENVANIDNRVTNVEGDITTMGDSIANNTTNIDTLQQDALQWNETLGAYDASHGTGDAQKITNVAAGELSADSTDAVNGSQLFDTNENVANIDNRVTNVEGDITTIQGDVAGNTTNIDALQQDALQWNETLGAYDASHGTGDAQKITNVAAGELSADSTDAVNGSQLFATNESISNLSGDITNIAGDVTTLGDTITNINEKGTKYFHANSTGADSEATGVDSVAIGMGAAASHDGSIALGAGSIANGSTLSKEAYLVGGTARGEVNIGDRRITGLSAGAEDSDAVNVAQLKQVSSESVASAVQYDGADHSKVTLGGADGTTITNVAAGELSADSTDAVNGSQLFDTNENVANIDNRVTNVEGDITTIQGDVAGNTTNIDALQQDALQWNETLGAYDASHGTGDAQKITNVAAGELSADSTDAVNGSQLFDTNENVANIDNRVTNVEGDITTIQGDIAGNTTNIDALQQDALQWNETLGAYDASHGTGDAQKITNVAAGELSADSTDAVNGSQLFATNESISNLSGDITNIAGDVTTLGDTITNINEKGTQYFHANSTGADSEATGVDSVAIGMGAVASHDGSIALGANSVADGSTLSKEAYLVGGTAKGEVNIGDRRITGLSAGAEDTDAVNVAQLKRVATESVANAVQYDGDDHSKVTLGGADGTTITNVAAGELSASSTDAVNGSQLFETNENVTNLDGRVTNVEGDIVNLGDAITNNTTNIDALQQDALQWNETLGAYDASHGTGDAQKITNVAAGELSADSTDAVNGSQLFDTNENVANIDNRVTNVEGDITTIQGDVAGNTTNIDALQQDALQWNADLGAYDASHGSGEAQKITNVAAGELSADSTDAVNGSQLFATNESISNLSGDITNIAGDVTNLGDTITNINEKGTKYFHANSTGADSEATGVDSVAIGMGAVASHDGSIALGANSVADGSTLSKEAYLVGGTAKGEVAGQVADAFVGCKQLRAVHRIGAVGGEFASGHVGDLLRFARTMAGIVRT
ncbi:hypothetical protein QO207_25290, partial [Pseudomonas sp. CAN2814]